MGAGGTALGGYYGGAAGAQAGGQAGKQMGQGVAGAGYNPNGAMFAPQSQPQTSMFNNSPAYQQQRGVYPTMQQQGYKYS
jgi:hypothetical protein